MCFFGKGYQFGLRRWRFNIFEDKINSEMQIYIIIFTIFDIKYEECYKLLSFSYFCEFQSSQDNCFKCVSLFKIAGSSSNLLNHNNDIPIKKNNLKKCSLVNWQYFNFVCNA